MPGLGSARHLSQFVQCKAVREVAKKKRVRVPPRSRNPAIDILFFLRPLDLQGEKNKVKNEIAPPPAPELAGNGFGTLFWHHFEILEVSEALDATTGKLSARSTS